MPNPNAINEKALAEEVIRELRRGPKSTPTLVEKLAQNNREKQRLYKDAIMTLLELHIASFGKNWRLQLTPEARSCSKGELEQLLA